MPNHTNSKIYRMDTPPLRTLLLWGFDGDNNPSVLALYGVHEFERGEELKDDVTYTDYCIFRGRQGHFPSFEAVKILDDFNYKTRVRTRNMYYKKDIKGGGYYYYYQVENKIDDFHSLEKQDAIVIPYFEDLKYQDYVSIVRKKRLVFPNFRLAEQPKDVLKPGKELEQYEDSLYNIFCNPRIYSRKKHLRELIQSNPPGSLYDFLLKKGSNELIAGLFLELAKLKNPILLKEANQLLNAQITWTSESYGKGLKRCALLYIRSFDENERAERIQWIKETLPGMDLYYHDEKGELVPMEGQGYRKYALYGYLAEKRGYFDETRHYCYKRAEEHYKKSPYCDGVALDSIELKNTIQEAEIYGLAEVIGKIAYYLDAPRLTYYARANGKWKGLLYFRKYVRRIMDNYAKNDPEKFMEAMKALFTSYTEGDYLCKFRGNFQFNYFIKHYLYHGFTEKAPEDWWGRCQWMKNDQLKKLEGRYEYMPDLWEKHMDAIIAIVSVSKVEVILKAFYYILLDCNDNQPELDYAQLVRLSDCTYGPIGDLFAEKLAEKLAREDNFDPQVMFALLPSTNDKIHDMGLAYFERTKGKLPTDDLIEFLFSDNLARWSDFFVGLLGRLNEQESYDFIIQLFENQQRLKNSDIPLDENTKTAIFALSENIHLAQYQQALVELLTPTRDNKKPYTDFLMDLIEKILFSIPYQDLKAMLQSIPIEEKEIIPGQGRLLASFLLAVKADKIPADYQIMEILQSGTPDMVRVLVKNISNNISQLNGRFSTLLIMLEASVEALNQLAKQVFEGLAKEEQKKLHSLMIDSPEEKVFAYGMEKLVALYELEKECIPEDLILQMLEHPSPQVKDFVSNKMLHMITHLGNGQEELFLYYVKTLLYLPNRISKAKETIYGVLPQFVKAYRHKQPEVEKILFDLGGSNIRLDSERALCALAQIKKEVISSEG